jgi:SAM-dependent methyltransferase
MGLYQNYCLAPLMDWVLARPAIDERRRRVVGGASGRVLEIGYGTGLNLPHYGHQVSGLTLLDNQRLLARRVKQRMDACRARQVVTIQATAEKLPFADGTFDCVVSTFTLCTIDDVAAALAEVRRVLAPRGPLLFLEHGRSDSRSLALWQDRLSPLQRCWTGGCNLNRPIARLLEEAGLAIVHLDRSPLAGAPRLIDMYAGVATK